MYVPGKVFDVELDWLVDTGCSTSLLSVGFFKKLTKKWPIQLQDDGEELRSADGGSLTVWGRTDVTLSVGGEEYCHSVIVADLTNEGILGMDFLKMYGGTLDFKRNRLSLDGMEVPVQSLLDSKRCYRVVLKEEVVVPAGSRVVLDGKVKAGVLPVGPWMVEPLKKPLGKEMLLVGRCLVTGGTSRVAVEVCNPSSEEVILHKETHAAMVHPVSVRGELQDEDVFTKQFCRRMTVTPSLPDELQDVFTRIQPGLTSQEQKEVKEVLHRHRDAFQLSGDPLGRTNLVQHEIETQGPPIKQHPRRFPLGLRDEGRKQVEEMLKSDIIEPSTSPWASPVVLVKKKDGSYRFCIDYRKLNNVTIKDSYPLPWIDETLDSLAGARCFSTLDLASGYWQVGLSEDAKQKSAFVTDQGLFQFKVLPFGLCNAPGTFERLMERVLQGLRWQILLIYLDDVIIFSRTVKEHIERLDLVLRKLKGAGLKLKPKKCHLFQKQVVYLGHLVSEQGVSTDPSKIEVMEKWPTPKDVSDVRSALGLFCYYKRFIQGYSTLARPLIKLTEKNVPFVWGEEQEEAWITLKKKMLEAPILAYPDPEENFILDTDASGYGVGAVLSQIQDGKERVIAFGSRTLTKEERRYCTTRRELLAVVYFLKHYRHYLFGKRFLLRTDHGSLRFLLNFKDPQGQMARWLQVIGTYTFDVEHRPGRSHGNADAMSRGPCRQCGREETSIVRVVTRSQRRKEESASRKDTVVSVPEEPMVKGKRILYPNWIKDKSLQPEELLKEQEQDPVLGVILRMKKDADKPDWDFVASQGTEFKSYWSQWESLVLDPDGLLCRKFVPVRGQVRLQVVIPKGMVDKLLGLLHDSVTAGHMGYKRTLACARLRFYWYRQRESVQMWCASCSKCAARKMAPSRKRRASMKKHVTGEPFARIGIDISGPYNLSRDGNKYILVVSDYFTKWVEAYPMRDMEAKTVAEILVSDFVSRMGVPMIIHSDQGRNFESKMFAQMCQLLGMKKTRTTAFHPAGNGLVERFNRTLNEMLCTNGNENPTTWDRRLSLLTMAYRATPHESTGFSPNFLVYGRELYMPLDVVMGQPEGSEAIDELEYVKDLRERLEDAYDIAREHLRESAERQKRHYDVRAYEDPYTEGDLVWIMNKTRKKGKCPKMQDRWIGPLVVEKRLNDVTYRVRVNENSKKVVHYDLLKPYIGRDVPQWVKKAQRGILDANAKTSSPCASGN